MTAETELSYTTKPETKSRHGTTKLLAVVALAALASAACSSGSGSGGSTPEGSGSVAASNRPQATRSTAAASPAMCELANGVRKASLRYSGSVHLSSLVGTKVDFGDHDTGGECFERTTLRFTGKAATSSQWPGVFAEYVKAPVRANPSDQTVEVPGNAFLQVTTGSWMYGQGGGAGPSRVSDPSVERIKGAVLTQNYEGYTTWTIGLDEERDFTLGQVAGTAACPDLCITVDFEDPVPVS